MREKYESLSLVVLRDLAKARGLKNISSMKKSDLVNRMLEEDARKQKETESMQTQEERGERVKAKEVMCKRMIPVHIIQIQSKRHTTIACSNTEIRHTDRVETLQVL